MHSITQLTCVCVQVFSINPTLQCREVKQVAALLTIIQWRLSHIAVSLSEAVPFESEHIPTITLQSRGHVAYSNLDNVLL